MTLRGLLIASGLLLAANLTMAASCQPQPAPVGIGGSPGTGGGAAVGGQRPTDGGLGTGGSGTVDGRTLCVVATLVSLDRQRQARENGMSIEQLADSMCSFAAVQECFSSGACK